ncbi:hypothetical protein J6590_008078 [Homalodisca vitripennis]|nr:hypothetical protein J6590_008078 [Homalodisca vitripennis]
MSVISSVKRLYGRILKKLIELEYEEIEELTSGKKTKKPTWFDRAMASMRGRAINEDAWRDSKMFRSKCGRHCRYMHGVHKRVPQTGVADSKLIIPKKCPITYVENVSFS